MIVGDLVTTTVKQLKRNSPEILTAAGVTGVIMTAYLASKASIEAAEIVRMDEAVGGTHSDPKERWKERVKHTWRLYIPAAVSGTVTIACIIGGTKAQAQKTAAAVAAYSLTERAFSEYKDKVAEQIGINKEQAIRDEIAQDRVNENPPSQAILMPVEGNSLCYEQHTGRYFWCTMERLLSAQNKINEQILRQDYVLLDEFYEMIWIAPTSASRKMGWEDGKLLELQFSAVLTDEGRPCMAFDYNYIRPIT